MTFRQTTWKGARIQEGSTWRNSVALYQVVHGGTYHRLSRLFFFTGRMRCGERYRGSPADYIRVSRDHLDRWSICGECARHKPVLMPQLSMLDELARLRGLDAAERRVELERKLPVQRLNLISALGGVASRGSDWGAMIPEFESMIEPDVLSLLNAGAEEFRRLQGCPGLAELLSAVDDLARDFPEDLAATVLYAVVMGGHGGAEAFDGLRQRFEEPRP